MKRYLLLGLFMSVLSLAGAQEYFQQHVAYTIHVKLDDEQHVLRGDEEVVYTNNSPDSLTFLYFHLWPNAYKNRKTALARQLVRIGSAEMLLASNDELGYVDSLAFTLDGLPCWWMFDPDHIDVCKIMLERPLPPGEQVTVATPFKVKLPSGSISRLGHIGQSYQITQWYPKPAVYDTAGWHPMPYLTQGEFYSEFGTFDVFIELPENYTVGATGDLKTDTEVERLNELASKTQTWLDLRKEENDWISFRSEMSFPESADQYKTLHYHQERVHDFGWFADKRYRVLKGKVGLPNSGDTCTVWTMFTNRNARLWSESIEYMHDAIYYYSLWNGDYPYAHATAVDGTISAGGGMEYPNVTVIGNATSALQLETVIMHEVGHNWFYGILGSNEREHAWLDEGLNSYNEQRYLSTKYPSGSLFTTTPPNGLLRFVGLDHYGLKDVHYLTYLLMARPNRDQPLSISANHYSFLNYGAVVYSKSAVFLNYMRHYLGDEVMDETMQQYFTQHKFQHPTPKSFEAAIEGSANKDLDWFFEDVVRTTAKLDYGMGRVKVEEGKTIVKIKNSGGLVSPVHVALLDEDEVVEEKWIDGFPKDSTITFSGTAERVQIDPGTIMPEIRRDNNYARTKGPFKRVEPLKLKLVGSAERPDVNQIALIPMFAANVPNGFMPGLLLHNGTVPSRRFSYYFLPLFSTKEVLPVGLGNISLSLCPKKSAFESIELGVRGKRYVHNRVAETAFTYNRLVPSLTFYLRPPTYSGLYTHHFSFESVIAHTEVAQINSDATIGKKDLVDVYNRGQYEFKLNHPVYALDGTWQLEEYSRDGSFFRTSLELREVITVENKFRSTIRFFGGAFLSNSTTNPAYNWRMDGQNFATDYAYDSEILDRSGASDVWTNQMTETHGAIKVPTASGQSNRWITALNVKVRPGRIPLGLFTDVGVNHTGDVVADAGVYLSLIPEVVEVYMPLLYTQNVQRQINANGWKFYDLIRFQFDIDRINPIQYIRRSDIP